MSFATRSTQVINALLAKSGSINTANTTSLSLDAPDMSRRRKAMGNHLSLRPELRTQWLLADFDSALKDATSGDLTKAVLLWKSICTDAVFRGVFDTFTAGVVALPKKFRGQERYVEALEQGHESVRSLFTEIMPPRAIALNGV